jgi:eukaryotic-like serine/threonine-protein kinase
MIFGTPEYMAPEQAAGREADHRVDIYACGIILFEMLTGAVPFTGDSFMAVLAAHLNDPPPSMMVYRPDLDVSQALHDVVAKTLEKDPRLRYQTMGELASAILATPEGARWHGASGAASGAVLGGRDSSPSSKPGSPTSAQFRPSSMSDTDRPPTPGPAPTAGTVGAESSHDLDAGTGARHVGVARRRGLGVALGGLVAVFAAIGGVGYYWVPGNTEAPSPRLEPAAAHPNAHPSVVDAEQGLQGGAPTAAPRPVVHPTAAATMVTLQVKTVPAGAVISRDGFQVCDSTPCTLEVDKGAAITLDAASGRAKGSAKVLATGDQAVSIQLVVPKAVRKAPVKKKKDDRLCEAPGPGGLKIFRPCRELGQ